MPPEQRPGRFCPASYGYSPAVFRRAPEIDARTLYVIGGLYGNLPALDEIERMADAEPAPPRLAFNGDFHWFDCAHGQFAEIQARVLRHAAIRGNVETEVAEDSGGAGCGCAYPEDVADGIVERSNAILARLRETARAQPDARAALARLPMHVVARVGGLRVGIVHGDAESLAGWGFAHDALDDPRRRAWIERCFGEARVGAFASSHTCLPALRRFDIASEPRVVVNNGAAGMPNFSGAAYGVITRISVAPSPFAPLYGTALGGVRIDALAVRYDQPRWMKEFLAQWPAGSAAHVSYLERIVSGPAFALERAGGLVRAA